MGDSKTIVFGPKLSKDNKVTLKLSLNFAFQALISCERQLNLVDNNGDIGSRLKNFSVEALKAIKNEIYLEHPYKLFKKLKELSEEVIDRRLGGFYSVIFNASANVFAKLDANETIYPHLWFKCLENTIEVLERYYNCGLGDETMYTPLKLCELAIKDSLEKNNSLVECFGNGVIAAEEFTLETKKYCDAGAHAVSIWMRAIFEGIKFHYPS